MNITPAQVNYDGNRPYANGAKGEYRERTVAVKSLPANSWGLYEMHGNVWEWCLDEWRSDLGLLSVTNPAHVQTMSVVETGLSLVQTGILPAGSLAHPGNGAVSSVLRGGSWGNFGWCCRSAFRSFGFSSEPSGLFGFRFVLDHEKEQQHIN